MPPASGPRPGRYLAVLLLVLVAMYAGVLGAGLGPKLGLDLEGGTSVILTPQSKKGTVSADQLDQAVKIIRQRVNGTGVTEASVVTQGKNIVISVPGKGRGSVSELGSTAQLRFRQVLQVVNPGPAAAPAPSASVPPSPSPSTAGSAAPSASAEPAGSPAPSASAHATTSGPSPTSNGRVISGALAAASATPSPAPSGAAAPAAAPAPSASGAVDQSNAGLQKQLQTLDCTKPENREGIGANDDPAKPLVACSRDGTAKYLLAPAKVVGTGVSGANAVLDSQNFQWSVTVSFNGKGQSKFTQLTRDVVNLAPPRNQVAIVLDGLVVSAPQIINAIPGNAQITGQFSQQEAKDLANVLKYGALPLTFKTSQEQSVSPTLGRDQLDAGLLAGGIGLALVVVYSLLYYRGLGLVTIASLGLAGLVTYAAVALLGAQLNYRLSLAGVAGLIVSIGITADSFVVFYERVKDEVRDGKTLRQAVDRGWVRGRRTILSADTVSFLGAVILYFVSVGDVRGFAFTLGLSTIIDVFIVFMFTHPLVTLLARTKRFSSPRFTGLKPVQRVAVAGPRAQRRREREAVSAGQAGSASAEEAPA